MSAARIFAVVVGVLAGIDAVRRLILGRGVNTWTFVGEMGVVGAALGINFAEDAGDAVMRSILFFLVWAFGALLFDTWLERPPR